MKNYYGIDKEGYVAGISVAEEHRPARLRRDNPPAIQQDPVVRFKIYVFVRQTRNRRIGDHLFVGMEHETILASGHRQHGNECKRHDKNFIMPVYQHKSPSWSGSSTARNSRTGPCREGSAPLSFAVTAGSLIKYFLLNSNLFFIWYMVILVGKIGIINPMRAGGTGNGQMDQESGT